MKPLILLLLLAPSIWAQGSQSPPQNPCTVEEAKQFDFWIGEWNLTWKDAQGNTQTGSNSISKVLDGCILQENFNSPITNFKGMSWSVYNPQRKVWNQTWVDNGAGYIPLSGKFEDGKMVLATPERTLPNGNKQINRMVFHDITPTSLKWRWEATTDGGATWNVLWDIQYTRK